MFSKTGLWDRLGAIEGETYTVGCFPGSCLDALRLTAQRLPLGAQRQNEAGEGDDSLQASGVVLKSHHLSQPLWRAENNGGSKKCLFVRASTLF